MFMLSADFIWLMGPGTQQEGSDIDVVIVSSDFTGKDYWTRINILSEAIYKVFAPIQAVAMTPKSGKAKKVRFVILPRKVRLLLPDVIRLRVETRDTIFDQLIYCVPKLASPNLSIN